MTPSPVYPYAPIRTEAGDPVRKAQADDLGAIVITKAAEEAWAAGESIDLNTFDRRSPITVDRRTGKANRRETKSETLARIAGMAAGEVGVMSPDGLHRYCPHCGGEL